MTGENGIRRIGLGTFADYVNINGSERIKRIAAQREWYTNPHKPAYMSYQAATAGIRKAVRENDPLNSANRWSSGHLRACEATTKSWPTVCKRSWNVAGHTMLRELSKLRLSFAAHWRAHPYLPPDRPHLQG